MRIDYLQKQLEKNGLEGYLVENPIDLYYFTGLDLSAGKLLVTKESVALHVDGRYFEAAKNKSPIPVLLASEKAFIESIKGIKTLGVDSELTSHQSFLDLHTQLNKEGTSLIPLKGIIRQLRAVKGPEEIALLRKAAELGSLGYDYVLTLLREGVSEKEVAFELEFFWRKKGATGTSFDPIIAFGENSSMPHYRAGNRKLKRGDIALIDIGVTLDHYHSDMTRVQFFGPPSDTLEKVREIVAEALFKACALLKPGVRIGDVDAVARDHIASMGYGEHFTHSLGHGVGLEIHEYPTLRSNGPSSNDLLQEGMVITIEPGIYLPGVGGVRLEDTVVITKSGYEDLTKRAYA